MARKTKTQKAEKAESLEILRGLLPEGTKIYSISRGVAKSGLSRRIDFYAIHDGEPYYLTCHFSKVLGWTLTREGLRVDGCGMDMGFYAVYCLASILFSGTERAGYKLTNNWL
jgi:hypothetical protein